MRFADRITFVTKEESYYDPDLGDYVESEPIKDTLPCKLSTMGIDRQKELFGDINTQTNIARLQHPYGIDFDYVELDEKSYKVIQQSDYRKGVLFLERDSLGD